MINKKMNDAFNKQINEEVYSSYLYLSMASHFDSLGLTGFSRWMKLQAQEEMFHAMKFYNHIVERGGKVELLAISEPGKTWNSALKVFEASLEHEKHITSCINKLMDLSLKENDYASRSMLQWFVDEQVEEEASFTEVLDKLKLIGDKGHMLYMIDKELSARQPGINPFDSQAQAAE
jgi:ferritin